MTHSLTHFDCVDLLDTTSALHQLYPPACLALIGTPVAYSRSPEIHGEYIKKQNLPWRYVAIDVQPEELTRSFEFLRYSNFMGFNVTMPHKQKALALVDELTDHARLLGAINTVVIRDGQFFGSNTDGPGFVQALQKQWNLSLQNLSLLILGATGGAGRALAMQSALEGCRQLFLASRTPSVLQENVKKLSQVNPNLAVEAILLDLPSLARAMSQVDLVVNATPVGFLNHNIPSLIPSALFEPRHYAYDIVCSTNPTPLMQSAIQAGAHSADGSAMILLQGALSFEKWFRQT